MPSRDGSAAVGRVLVLDVGGTHVKASVDGRGPKVALRSGLHLTAARMVKELKLQIRGWRYDRVSIGYPGPVVLGHPLAEPHNLGHGWVGFDFHAAFRRPVRIINDAAMQALGSYHGGRMLFLGLGTGLGSAMIIDGELQPMELAHLPYKKGRTYEDYVGLRGLERLGLKKWRRRVNEVVMQLRQALEPDTVVIGGGNAKLLKKAPEGACLVDNRAAFVGGVRLWTYETGGTARAGPGRVTHKPEREPTIVGPRWEECSGWDTLGRVGGRRRSKRGLLR